MTGNIESIGALDHSQTSEYRIFGPPGTGKTTALSRQIRRAVEKYGEGQVLVTSFSRAAATELAGRDLPIGRHQIGTLHSHCFHALGAPKIAECNIEAWNEQNPHLKMSGKKSSATDADDLTLTETDPMSDTPGDTYLEQLSRFRGMMTPRQVWPAYLQAFSELWDAYKRESQLLDFTDLIEIALNETTEAPGGPAVIFADEAQDLNRMQLTLVRKWGRQAKYFVVAADDDQTIYGFTGATPEAVLDPEIPEGHKIILKQSFRVPRAVHARANEFIKQVERRQAKEYLPRDADGMLAYHPGGTYLSAEDYIRGALEEHLAAGRSVMLLASCEYMLRGVTSMLRKHAIPYHNPYRRTNGAWNPLRFGGKKSLGAINRLNALLVAHPDYGFHQHPWTYADLAAWTEWVAAKGILRRGAKKFIADQDQTMRVTESEAAAIFEDGALPEVVGLFSQSYTELLKWWSARLISSVQARAEFPVAIAAKHGIDALRQSPKVIIGTIHSVKGGEADAVFLFPDLSAAGARSYASGGRDAAIRLFYVGMTRAKEALHLCSPVGSGAVQM